MKLTDKEKTAEILKRINIMTAGNIADNFVKINEFRLGSAYSGFSEQRMDCFAISPNAGNKTICYEIKVSRRVCPQIARGRSCKHHFSK